MKILTFSKVFILVILAGIITVAFIHINFSRIFASPLPHTAPTQISGKIIDRATQEAIAGAKIILLDALTRELILTDIVTDANGKYEADLNLVTQTPPNVSQMPTGYWVGSGYPNPVAAATTGRVTVKYAIPGNLPETPNLEIFDILGHRIADHDFLTSGIYFYRLKFRNGFCTDSKKMVLTSGGYLKFELQQINANSNPILRKSIDFKKMTSEEVNLIFQIEKNGYALMERLVRLTPGENNENNFALLKAGATTSATVDCTGAELMVVNSRGDSIFLEIPCYAVWDATEITLTTFETTPENPIAKNVFPGVNLGPAGLKLLQPATLKIVLAETISAPDLTTLFFIKQADWILPIGDQHASENALSGEIYHFSDFAAGEPTTGEMAGQINKISEYGTSNQDDWRVGGSVGGSGSDRAEQLFIMMLRL